MKQHLPLLGVRVHLSGSIPEESTKEEADAIGSFVETFTRAVLREGATLIHGSHPTFQGPLKAAAEPFVHSGGERDALTLVRARKYCDTPEQLAEVNAQREYSAVQIAPASPGNPNESLVPMREWMAERSDVVVAVGGKWYQTNKPRAGVPVELEEALSRGNPGFAVAGFGGAIAAYVKDDESVFNRLRNGLSVSENRILAENRNIGEIVDLILSQIMVLPLIRGTVQRGRLFRILALDGGGLRGTFTAAVLAKWDDMLKSGGGTDIVKHFDLVAGTSTGAILAIGLGLGMTPAKMLEFYKTQGPKIFPKDRKLRHWLKSKHESETLRSILEAVLKDRTLSKDSLCRLVLPTVRAINGESETIVTAHSLDRTGFSEISAVDAVLASSAAPTYFDEAVVDTAIAAESFLDGGIWANNPVLPAIAEAVSHLKIPLDRIDVLSVGTMANESDFSEALGKGIAGWAPHSVDLFFAAQEHAAASLADKFLSLSRHLRINQQTPSEIKLDDKEAIEDMVQRGINVGKDSFLTVRSRFLDGFHAPDWRSES